MLVAKCIRTRIVIFVLLFTLLWMTIYYFMKSANEDLNEDTKTSFIRRDVAMVEITVFYECLCPDSRSFFVKQLLPAVEKLPDRLKVDFIPYGKAQTEVISPAVYKFSCQHGAQECLGNKVHACVIKRVSDELIRSRVLTCMISDNYNPEEIGKKCSRDYNLDWNDIWKCTESFEGDKLLKKYGEKTNALSPSVTFIPTILLNNDLGSQTAILKDLWKEICLKFKEMSKLPESCAGY